MSVRTSRFRWLLGLIVVGASAVAVALAAGSSASSPPRPAGTPGAVGQGGRDAALARLSVLRDAKGEAPTSEHIDRLGGVMERVPGSDPRAAADTLARVARSDEAANILVGLSDDYLCLVVRDHHAGTSSTGCTDPATAGDAARPLASVDFVGSDHWRVTALMVDGIDKLSLTNTAGTRIIDVVNNIATATIPAGVIRLDWTAPDGTARSLSVNAS